MPLLRGFGQGNPDPKLLRWQPRFANATGAGVRVALLDSGLNWQHPQFRQATIQVKDFTGSGSLADATGHGTQMAALLVGTTGLVPAATLLLGKVLASTGSDRRERDLAKGIDWAVQQGADILTLPLGRRRPSRRIQCAIHRALRAGVMVFAAAGNHDPEQVLFPACLPGVMAITGGQLSGVVLPGCAQATAVDGIALGQIPCPDDFTLGKEAVVPQLVGSSPATVIAAALATLERSLEIAHDG
jgi:subtilisin family serine protease